MMLKSQNKYRRLRKPFIFILSIILSFSVLTLVGFKNPYKASNFNVIVTNEYGSFTRGNWSASILNTTYSTSAVIGELNGVYNGRVTINYSTDPTTQNLLFIPINCAMESTSGNSITIIFKNVSSFMVLIDGSGADTLQVNSMTSWNMTKITDGTNTQLNSVISYIDNIETLLTTNNTTLGLIYNYIQTLDTSNTDISIDVGDIQVDVNDIEVGIGDLLSAITSMITDGINTVTLGDLLEELEQANSYLGNVNSKLQLIQGSLHSAVTHLSNITNYSSQINTNVSDIELIVTNINSNILTAKNDIADLKTYVNSIVTTLNNINTTLSNIDNLIDIISWNNVTVKGLTTDLTTFTNPYIRQRLTDSQYIAFGMINFNNALLSQTPIFKLTIPSYPSVNGNTINIYGGTSVNSKINVSEYDILYQNIGRRSIDIYFKPTLNSPIAGNVYLFFNAPDLYVYTDSPTLTWIGQNDIEYWNLLNLFNLYNYKIELLSKLNTLTPYNYNSKLDSILNAINNINMSVTNTTVNDTEVNIDNYNDIYTDIENIEIQFINNFNTTNNNIDKTIFVRTIDISEPKNALETTLSSFMSNDYIKNIVYLFLLTVIIIAILG